MSHKQEFSPTITAFNPIIGGSPDNYILPGTPVLPTLARQIENYSHTIQAIGGYWSAQFKINTNQRELEKWITEGLGRHIEVTDSASVIIWEGFVNKVSTSIGPLDFVAGPMMDVDNDVDLEYTTLDTTGVTPVFGAQKQLSQDDTDSIAKYGYWPTSLSGGDISDARAADQLATYLLENAYPTNSKSVNLGSANAPQVSVECLGYIYMYDKMPYDAAAGVDIDLSDKIIAVLDAQLNDVIDTSWSRITSNTRQVAPYENRQNSGWQVIKRLLSFGDASYNRYLFGIYANQMPVYEQAPMTLEYQQQLSDPEQKITTLGGGRVLPWHVLPGKWLAFSDFLVGEAEPDDLRQDPRAMFIESVTYTAPWGLQLRGGKTDTFAQKLAQTGLGTKAA
jgi:hypothetical protein